MYETVSPQEKIIAFGRVKYGLCTVLFTVNIICMVGLKGSVYMMAG